jgi:hypothetical protein
MLLKKIAIGFLMYTIPAMAMAQSPTKAPYINTNIPRGTELRILRLAKSVTGEHTQSMPGATNEEKVNEVLRRLKESVATINEIYGREFCVRFELLPDELHRKIIFTNPATDPWPDMKGIGCEGAEKIHKVQGRVIDSIIGKENYDISHVILGGNTGGCAGSFKIGYTGGIDKKANVARHEMGHQFQAGHTCNAEPSGAGKTLMCCNCEDFAHSDSYRAVAFTLLNGEKNSGRNIPTGNQIPEVNAGLDKAIPIGTPFTLTGYAKDADADDKLTYVWDQLDWGESMSLPRKNDEFGPLFTRYIPTRQPSRTFPTMDSVIENILASKMEQLPTQPRELNFRLMVNDNHQIKYNGEMINASGIHSDDIKLTVVNNGGAFKVTSQEKEETYTGGEKIKISWNVSGTHLAPINTENVTISLSCDGGKTFSITLLYSTPNDGEAEVVLPNFNTKLCRIKVQAIDNYFFSINQKNFIINQNLTLPGIKVSSKTSTLLISENSYTASYTVGLNTMPTGTVKVKVYSQNQALLSKDGKSFSASQILSLIDTTPITLTVLGKEDKEFEGVHFDVIRHGVIETEDNNYPTSMVGEPISTKISDAQIPPIIGVAFTTEASTNFPKNWIKISDVKNKTFNNISLEDGQKTTISLSSTSTDCGIGGCSFTGPIYGDKPIHNQSLGQLNGVGIARGTTTFTWSGLESNKKYRLFVFGYNLFGLLKQIVTITGEGAPLTFNQDCPRGVLYINDRLSSDGYLMNYAKEMTASNDGKIIISVTTISGKDEISITGLGICK